MPKRGERKINRAVVLSLVEEQGIINASMLATRTKTHYTTAERILNDLVLEGILLIRKYKFSKNESRLYELNELEDETEKCEIAPTLIE